MDSTPDTPHSGQITASPNPLPPGNSPCVIRWKTVPRAPVEIAVVDNGGPEKVVTRGSNGACEVDWIRDGHDYKFLLYSTDPARQKLAEVQVHRSEISLNAIAVGDLQPSELRQAKEAGEPAGFDLNPTSQRRFLRGIFPAYTAELEQIPSTHSESSDHSYFASGGFGRLDAAMTYCVIRYLSPKRIIEVGGGQLTLLLRKALQMNRSGKLLCLDPNPARILFEKETGPDQLLPCPLQSVDLATFAELELNDILSVNTSHLSKNGSDVNYLFLEVLPRLQTGVVIHLRDIFLPLDHFPMWKKQHFENGQYLLQAFLSGNADFEVILNAGYLLKNHISELQKTFPRCRQMEGGSFWMRRRRATGAKRVFLRRKVVIDPP